MVYQNRWFLTPSLSCYLFITIMGDIYYWKSCRLWYPHPTLFMDGPLYENDGLGPPLNICCEFLWFIQGVPPICWQLRTKFWKLKNHICQKVSPVLKFLGKKLLDGTLKLGVIGSIFKLNTKKMGWHTISPLEYLAPWHFLPLADLDRYSLWIIVPPEQSPPQ